MFAAIGVKLLLSPFSSQSKKYVCILNTLYAYLKILHYVTICTYIKLNMSSF